LPLLKNVLRTGPAHRGTKWEGVLDRVAREMPVCRRKDRRELCVWAAGASKGELPHHPRQAQRAFHHNVHLRPPKHEATLINKAEQPNSHDKRRAYFQQFWPTPADQILHAACTLWPPRNARDMRNPTDLRLTRTSGYHHPAAPNFRDIHARAQPASKRL